MINTKIYTRILTLALVAIISFSCDDDDLGPFNELVVDATEDVNVTIEPLRDITAEDDDLPVTVTISRSFEVDASITVTSFLENRSFVTSTITVPAGATTGTGTVSLPPDDELTFSNFDEVATLEATAILADDGNGFIYLPVSNAPTVRILDAFPSVVIEGGISFAFFWRTGTTDDYDFFYNGGAGATGNPIEFIEFTNDEILDGPILVEYNPFAIAAETDVEYIAVVRINNPDGTNEVQTFTGTLDAANNDAAAVFPLLEVTRTTMVDNSDPAIPISTFDYSIVQLED